MNVEPNKESHDFWFSTAFLTLNFLNLVIWSLGFYIHPSIFLGVFLVWFVSLFFHLDRHWLTLATVICLILIVLGAPLFDWDARYIWFFHAKRIFVDNNLYAPLDNYFWEIHNDYPVLVPAIAASFAKGIGYWNEFFPRLSVIFVLIPAFLVMRILFKNSLSFGLALLGVLLISKQFLINGYMDAILGLYIALSCLLLVKLQLDPDEKRTFSLLMWCCLALPMIKNEGVLALLILSLSAALVLWKRKVRWLVMLSSFAVYYWLWKRPVAKAGIQTTDLFVSGVLDRALTRLGSHSDLLEIVSAMVRISGGYLVLLALFLWKFSGAIKTWRVPFSFAIIYTVAMGAIYLITNLDLTFHLEHSVDRVLLPVNLTIFLMLLSVYESRKTWNTRNYPG